MSTLSYEQENIIKQLGGFLAGLLVGGLAGTGAMLLLAPQSGKKTRDQLVKTVKDTMAQVSGKTHQIADDVHKQAGELAQRGQDVIDGQRDNLSQTLIGLGQSVHS
jgi:gas vesicle protein